MANNKAAPKQNALDLRKPLLNSQVQKTDQALFQTINQLLEQVQSLQQRVQVLENNLTPVLTTNI